MLLESTISPPLIISSTRLMASGTTSMNSSCSRRWGTVPVTQAANRWMRSSVKPGVV